MSSISPTLSWFFFFSFKQYCAYVSVGLGNPRGNENPFLLTFGIIWFRWHNKVAENLSAEHPTWTDETLFLEARKRVVAQHQVI